MGYCYYLRRDDNRTLFDLGKILGGDWGEFLGDGHPFTIEPDRVDDLAAALFVAMADWNLGSFPGGAEGYARQIARSISVWSDGKPFRLVGEDGYDDWDLDDYESAVTGTRHTPDPRIKDVLVFRNGNIAVCSRDGAQMPQYQGSLANDPLIIDRVRAFCGPDVVWKDARSPTGDLP